MCRQPARGFTLLEVLIALTIVSLSILAVAEVMGDMADKSNAMREKTYASWIAQNKITELRLANELPEVSSTSGDIEFGNALWYWRAEISESGVENLYRVDVTVYFPDEDTKVRSVTGFIGEPVPPGQANRIWQRGPSGSGAES